MFARIFKTKVDKFYLFFDIGFSLFKYKSKKSQTEYGLGWLPVGGYCKIAGMIDESMDTEHLKSEPQTWEFRSKSALQRLLIMLGGVIFNAVLAFFIYVGILTFCGNSYIANKDLRYGIACDSIALEMGFQNGDKILAVNDKPVINITDALTRMILYREMNITLQRGDETVNISPDYYKYISYMTKRKIIEAMPPYIVKNIPDSSQNKLSGLLPEDEVVGINGIRKNFLEIRKTVSENKNETITANVIRKGQSLEIPLQVNENGQIVIELEDEMDKLFPVTKEQYSVFAAFPAALIKAKKRICDQLYEIRLIFTPKTKTYKQVGSFISISKLYSPKWDWLHFWEITAFLSIMLAVLNVLPIPALDGGHVLFILFEIVTRRKPSDKFLTYAQVTGLIILVTLMAFAIGNDIMRHIFNVSQ
jgi:regulator of sigma E protease